MFSEAKISKLREVLEKSRRDLQPFREKRLAAIRQYVGKNYSDSGTTQRVPINLIDLATSVYTQALSSGRPRVLVTTKFQQLKANAYKLEQAINRLIEEIHLQATIQEAVEDSLFAPWGVVKIGMGGENIEHIDGVQVAYGQPFAEVVAFDDFVIDMEASTKRRCMFVGDIVRLRLSQLVDNPLYDQDAVARLKGQPPQTTNDGGDPRAETIGRGLATPGDQLEPFVSCWNLYLPESQMTVVLPCETGQPLRVAEWEGPETGPYRFLFYTRVPGNLLPKPPMADWLDVHDLANVVYNKLGQQAARQKTILGFDGEAEDDAKRVVESVDGEAIRMGAPDRIKEFKFGGVEAPSLAFLLQIKDLFTYMAGNLDALGGLSPQAKTLGQDELLEKNASKRVAAMQRCVVDFVRGVVSDLAHLLWHDPLIEIPFVHRSPSGLIEVPDAFTPEDREGDFLQYNFSIEPYSLQDSTPGSKLQALQLVLQNFILPFQQQMAAEGVYASPQKILKLVGKYLNMDELEDVLTFAMPTEAPEQPVGSPSGKAAFTKRTYERINRPGATTEGRDRAFINNLMSVGQQNSEAATMGRSNA